MKKLVVQPAETITSALQKIRFWPELGDYIDLQMAPAVISSQINPDRDKISQFSKNNYFCDETHIFSSHTISAATDSSNDPMRLEINQGTELGNQIDFQMTAHSARLTQIGTKYCNFCEIVISMQNPKFSARAQYLLLQTFPTIL